MALEVGDQRALPLVDAPAFIHEAGRHPELENDILVIRSMDDPARSLLAESTQPGSEKRPPGQPRTTGLPAHDADNLSAFGIQELEPIRTGSARLQTISRQAKHAITGLG